MSRIARLAVLVAALMSLFAVISSAAGAITWENGGQTSFTATAGSGTLGSTGVNLACAVASATGVAPATGFTPTGANVWSAATGTITLNNCTIGGSPATVDCGFTSTVVGAASSLDPASGTVTTTTGTADVTCSVYITGTKVCHIEGGTAGAHHNLAGSAGKGLSNVAASNALRLTGANCPLGTNDTGSLTALSFSVTAASGGSGTSGPVIVRA